MKVIFHSNQLFTRGTEVALYDYADFNERLLHNTSIIMTPKSGNHSELVIKKFKNRFEHIVFYEPGDLQKSVENTNAQVFYAIKAGENDGVFVQGMHNAIHAVFKNNDPHGDVYAYVSEWLSIEASGGKHPFVPHMIHLPNSDKNLRSELGIPREALVIGRYGGQTTFDIKFAKKAVENIAAKRKDIYFLFMGTEEFGGSWLRARNKRILFLPESTDLYQKVAFINTCDAMLHARKQGESFGLAVGEFSSKNKPIITFSGSKEKAHIFELGEKGIYYSNQRELEKILLNLEKSNEEIWDAYSLKFSPENVMQKFKQVFLAI